MNDSDHADTCEDNHILIAGDRAVSVADEQYRKCRDERPEYWDKSENKDDKRERQNIRKWLSSMNIAYKHEPHRCKDRIYEGDYRLRFHDKSEVIREFLPDVRKIFIEKSETSILKSIEKPNNTFSLENKNKREQQSDQDLDHDPTDISQIFQDDTPDLFDILRIDLLGEVGIQSEIDVKSCFCSHCHIIHVGYEHWRMTDQIADFFYDDRHDFYQEKNNQHDKDHIHHANDIIQIFFYEK